MIPITMALIVPAYWEWLNVSRRRAHLAAVQKREEECKKEHAAWGELAQRQRERRKRLSQLRQDLTASIHSFSRDELHDALKRAVEKARPDKAIIMESAHGLWGARSWIWIPEAGHQLNVRLAVTGLMPEDAAGEPLESRRLQVDMRPNKLHMVQFSIEERYRSKDCIVRLEVDNEALLERTLLLDPNSGSTHGGSNDGILVRPRVLAMNWLWTKDPTDLHRRGVWYAADQKEFGLQTRVRDSGGRQVKIQLSMGISHPDKPMYAQRTAKYALEKHGIEFTEVDDPDSSYHKLLELTPPRKSP